jgi:N6-L-threonylcarbamoyladenine synthase
MGQQFNWTIHIPSFEYCTDNAAMIALTGYYQLMAGKIDTLDITANARGTW